MRTPDFERFERVKAAGLGMAGVTAATKYDGSPVLKVGGVFLAGLAMHASVEPDTLVVRMELDDRDALIDDAPDVYYVTEYFRPHPVVLVRLQRLSPAALSDLLAVSWRLAMKKVRPRRVAT